MLACWTEMCWFYELASRKSSSQFILLCSLPVPPDSFWMHMKMLLCVQSTLSVCGSIIHTFFPKLVVLTKHFFWMPLNMTVNSKDDKGVVIRIGDNGKQWYIILLCIMTDGRKLLLYINLQRETLPQKKRTSKRKNWGWMDHVVNQDWVKCMSQNYREYILNLCRMHFWDGFCGRTQKKWKRAPKTL